MYLLRPAVDSDVDRLVQLRAEAAHWLAERGSDQWKNDWPNPDAMIARIREAVRNGETWCVQDRDVVIGTLSLNHTPYPGLWTPAELAEPSRYAHRVIVTRTYAGTGLGAELLDWAATQAAHAGEKWLRVDVWTTNISLQNYYLRHGFQHVRTLDLDGYPSGALFQRATEECATPRLTLA